MIGLVNEEDEDTLRREQAILDDHEDRMNEIMDCLTQLSHSRSSPTVVAPPMGPAQDEPMRTTSTDPQRGLNRRLVLIETELRDIANAVEAIERGPEFDRCLLEQHEEQISGLKSKLIDVSCNIATLDKDETGLEDRRCAIS